MIGNNAIIVKKVTLTGNYTPLSDVELVGDVTISSLPTNATAYLLSTDGANDDIPWLAGEWHDFKRVNLAGVYMKGTVGNVITIIGNRTTQVH